MLVVTNLFNGIVLLTLAIVVWLRAPDRRLARASAVFNLLLSTFSFSYALRQSTLNVAWAEGFHLVLCLMIIWVNQAFYHFIFVYLDMLARGRRVLRGLAIVHVVASLLMIAGLFYTPLRYRPGVGFWPDPLPLGVLYMIFWIGEVLLGYGLLLNAWMRARGHRRLQLAYVAFAYIIGYTGGSANFLVWFHIPVSLLAVNVLVSLYPLIIFFAIARHQLMDIQTLLRKTLLYSVVTGAMSLIYVGIVTLAAGTLGSWMTIPSPYASVLAVVVMAIFFQPIRRRLQAWIDQRFFRTELDPNQAIQQLFADMLDQTTPLGAAHALFRVLDGAVHPKRMALYLRQFSPAGFVRYAPKSPEVILPAQSAAQDPWVQYFEAGGDGVTNPPVEFSQAGVVAAFPLRSQQELLGFLLLGEKKSETPYSAADELWIHIAVNGAAVAYERVLLAVGRTDTARPHKLDDAARGVVHEIKTPLANISLPAQAIVGYLNSFEQGKRKLEDILPKLKEQLRFIKSQTVRAEDRIAAIRDFATLGDIRLEPVELRHLLRDCVNSLEPVLKQTDVTTHLPSSATTLFVLGNSGQLEIVFGNLIKNAAEAMAGASRRELAIVLAREGDAGRVDIRDTGSGIKAENLPHLFDRHFTTKGAAGTGVGLSLSRELIMIHNGTIEVSSVEGRGTTFTVRLPCWNPPEKMV